MSWGGGLLSNSNRERPFSVPGILYGICDGQSSTGTDSSPKALFFQCHFISQKFSMFIYLSVKGWRIDPLEGEVPCNLAPTQQ